MSREPSLSEAGAERLTGIPAGEIVLRDEGTKTNWRVEVGAFRLAPYPVTRALYRASCRRKSHPTFRVDDLGFRLARSGWRG